MVRQASILGFPDVWDELDRMSRSFDWVFDRRGRFSLSNAVEVTDDAMTITLELPGVDSEAVRVHLEGGVLSVKAERPDRKRENEVVVMQERPRGTYEQEFTLPWVADADKIQAHLRNGVLFVTVPKAEQEAPRAIEIQTD